METLAPILEQSDGEISFLVDDVQVCQDIIPVSEAWSKFEERLGSPLLAFSHSTSFEVIQESGNHPLVTAVHMAHSEHRPLLLTPDAIWLTIAQGFAQHINNNAEELRSRFVGHSGKLELKVETQKLDQPNDWAEVIEKWSERIRHNVKPDIHSLMVCNFSTTTSIIQTASQVVMMDAFQQYFDYMLYAICGIPGITVRGTEADWRSIRHRVEAIAAYDLGWWTERLLPICDALIDTVAGRPPLKFWQQIYKPKEIYGGEVITGWLADLFPYINHSVTHAPTQKNPILDIPRAELTVEDGISPTVLPTGLSKAPIALVTPQGKGDLEVVAGFIGVRQQDGYLQPEIGWAVRKQDRFLKLLTILEQKPSMRSPINWSETPSQPEMPKELIQLHSHFDGGTIVGQSKYPWHIRALQDYTYHELKGTSKQFTAFIDIEGDRCIAYSYVYRRRRSQDDRNRLLEWWVIVGKPVWEGTDPMFGQEVWTFTTEDVKVIANGIPQLLERIAKANGQYYFDDPDFQPDDSLSASR
ncbi:DUF4419 domain-containing protein [Funiculus sociatus GB2-A5]|uniref:DUF4419 domain-containing protein n=1 Tax=Funiculus sociatus GB2-A5 TaxID=2933946 RepID=A0ABV0JPW6_9CYAN|nr:MULTISPECIES: DUF4419 domain-containing protein [unclassified Trichocoleus]MBD1908063.1 DUF4419 domain-containing protein [Trichocoleus sp. FACHB-832]MBD2061619.1 DUF4419 domain-containing protein [Trichocoleus sp. FACHB-6]